MGVFRAGCSHLPGGDVWEAQLLREEQSQGSHPLNPPPTGKRSGFPGLPTGTSFPRLMCVWKQVQGQEEGSKRNVSWPGALVAC